MSKVQIPVVLRKATAGAKVVETAGTTVHEVLDDLYAQFPELRAQLRAEETLSPFVNIYLNGEDVRTLDGAQTPVGEKDTVTILPAMAGG